MAKISVNLDSMACDMDAYVTDLEKFKDVCLHMRTHFDLNSKGKMSLRPEVRDKSKFQNYYSNVTWNDDLLLQLYLKLSQNCKTREWNVLFWNMHNDVAPLEWLEEWKCFPALQFGSEQSAKDIDCKLDRKSIYHQEDPEKYIDHSPILSCWWTIVLSKDSSWGLYTDLEQNMHLFFKKKHLDIFNEHSERLKNLSSSEMIISEEVSE